MLHEIRTRVEVAGGSWIDELPNVLWCHRTTARVATGETPFHLAYDTEAVVPLEVDLPTLRTTHFDEAANNRALRENLDMLGERQNDASIRLVSYQERLAQYYNSRVRERRFFEGDLVLRCCSASDPRRAAGKLAPKWEGPYQVTQVLGKGSYKLTTPSGEAIPRTWHVSNVSYGCPQATHNLYNFVL